MVIDQITLELSIPAYAVSLLSGIIHNNKFGSNEYLCALTTKYNISDIMQLINCSNEQLKIARLEQHHVFCQTDSDLNTVQVWDTPREACDKN